MPQTSERQFALLRFCAAALRCDDIDLTRASTDAGFRSYWRVACSAKGSDPARTYIVMDAPPDLIACDGFLRVGSMLRDGGLNVPKVISQDLDQGFLLLSDLGPATYLEAINAGADAAPLFDAAIDALIRMQGIEVPAWLPRYDAALLEREIDLFPEWYLGRELGVTLIGSTAEGWNTARKKIIAAALAQPQVLVHRDFMPRNLMPPMTSAVNATTNAQPGILDFQDAVCGPIAYDPICLFKDAFMSWPRERVENWLAAYHRHGVTAGLALPDFTAFRRDADWIGMHRHLKVVGIFARLKHRDGKPKYLADAPRFFGYLLDVISEYPELAGLERLLRQYPPHERSAP